MPIKTGGLVNYNQKFIDTIEHIDTFIMNRARKHPVIWIDRIPKGVLTNYEGLTRTSNIFHGGLGEQAGLKNWSNIQTSRKPSGNDPGFDACNYDPKTFKYAVEAIQYTGYRSSWQSEPICVNDIRFLTEGREQARLITSFMAYITQSVWENWNREQYVRQAVLNDNAFILAEGGLDYSDSPAGRFDYDPFVEDADGDSYITFPSDLKVSTLNWSFFDWWQDYLGDECPEAAIANNDGLPVFGLMLHKRDFDRMILGDPNLRQDYRWANPKVLIADYRAFSEYKGWAIIHDSRQMRFKIKKITGGNVVAKRVTPFKEGRAATIGNIPVADPEYNNAELAVGVLFMNEVIQNLIPTPITNAGGGMVFGPAPGYNGDFRWINEYDRELNPLREVGYFFARFEAFPKPLLFSNRAIVFLYRRCPQTWATDCQTCCNGDTAATDAAVAVAEVVSTTQDTDNATITLRLAECLACEVGSTVSIASPTATGYIAVSNDSPTYTFVITSGDSDPANYSTSTTVTCA